ncbi:MAG: hypothetical protein AAF152_04805 [Cyanobacteria bacterium P01_A01_bin.114]
MVLAIVAIITPLGQGIALRFLGLLAMTKGGQAGDAIANNSEVKRSPAKTAKSKSKQATKKSKRLYEKWLTVSN